MPDESAKAVHLYEAVATRLAEQISQGQYPPGSMLPSETDLMSTFSISRPTARAAVAELRAMGLVESQRGRGSLVRQPTTRTDIDQTITRRGKKFTAYESQFVQAEEPHTTRTHITAAEAELIDHEDEAAFAVYRLLIDPTAGLRAQHRTLIPFELAAQHPQLQDIPATEPSEIYALLTAAGHTLTWHEYVTARRSTPDDRSALRVTDTAWLLETHRVTHSGKGGPLLLETLTASAETTRLTYRPERNQATSTGSRT
ncbi:GntR family transcriptional regulator [Actinacidiphila alni]|uniref:GntR family transcriptional regulator n=1 Tax=Actinacidiphila alni TaxID=380248 RepID=A0A1I2JGX7_9ACTN|nr:GntR family transcriptional regulator [Actinacidiphila alni]SFF54105.1 GntR family transcriptional regulator [Actinacidiphila alni]